MHKRGDSPTPTLPADIITAEILPKSNLKTLLRFKCVNKFFRNLISSHEFINNRMRQSLASGTDGLLIISKAANRNRVEGLYSFDLDSPLSPVRPIPLPKPFNGDSKLFDVVGTCNGLLCFRTPNRSHAIGRVNFMLLNPATGIVNSDISSIFVSVDPLFSVCLFFGFGYDCVNDDYKIVVVNYYRRGPHVCSHVAVYSMRGCLWKRVETKTVDFNIMRISSWRDLTTNGALIANHLVHWVNLSSNFDETFEIVCFDLESEKWVHNVPLPDFIDIGATKCLNLGVFDGCLCLSTNTRGVPETDVWIMKEYGVKESWVKLFIAMPTCECVPLSALGGKELLLSKTWPQKLGLKSCVWYNIGDQTTRMLEFSGDSPYYRVLTLCLGTLASVYGGRPIKEGIK